MHPMEMLRYFKLNLQNNDKYLEKGNTGRYFISQQLQNTVNYGITRSGKGEMYINPLIDLNSRASLKQNEIITDPKGENSSKKYITLKKRGFNVHVLNLLDMMHSMSFNPLHDIAKAASLGEINSAADECSQLAATIYKSNNNDGNSNKSFFDNSAASLFTASVFALLYIAQSNYYADIHPEMSFDEKVDKSAFDKITMYNVFQFITQMGGKAATNISSSVENDTKRINIFFSHLSDELASLRSRKDALDDIETDSLQMLDQAMTYFAQTNMASDDASGDVYATFIDGLNIYRNPQIAKLTSKNSLNNLELGFDHLITLQFNRGFALQDINLKIYTATRDENNNLVKNDELLEEDNARLNEIGLVEIPIEKSISTSEFVLEIKIHNERINGNGNFYWTINGKKTFYALEDFQRLMNDEELRPLASDMKIVENNGQKQVLDKYTDEPVFKKIKMDLVKKPHRSNFSKERIGNSKLNFLADEKRQLSSLKTDKLDFLYNEKPTALFLITPPDKTEANQLATFFINQTINNLSGYSLRKTSHRRLQRPLQLILDELGNFPAIPKLNDKISFGLSQLISFHLILQNKEQLTGLYGKGKAATILSNCATTNYILTKSEDTAKEISDAIGQRTVQTQTSNDDINLADIGRLDSVNKYNNGRMAQTIMPKTKLMHLKQGEMVILRATDRQSNTGNDVLPLPIFNTGNYLMPYSWWFLKGSMNEDMNLDSVPIVTPHKYLNLEYTLFDYSHIYSKFEEKNLKDRSYLKSLNFSIQRKIRDADISEDVKESYVNRINKIDKDARDKTSTTTRNDMIPELLKIQKELDNKSYKYLNKLTDVTKEMFNTLKGKQGKLLDYLSNMNSISSFDNINTQLEDVRDNFDKGYKNVINNSEINSSEYFDQLSNILFNNHQEIPNYDTLQSNIVTIINQIMRKYFVNNNILQSNVHVHKDDKGNEYTKVEMNLTSFGTSLVNDYEQYANDYSKEYHDLMDDNLPNSDPHIIFEYLIELISLYTNGITLDDGQTISMKQLEQDGQSNNNDAFFIGYDAFLIMSNDQMIMDFTGNEDISFTNYFSYIFGVFDKFITFVNDRTNGVELDKIGSISVSDNYNSLIQDLVDLSKAIEAL
ncbi:hypothetical protein DY037_05335 [Apilactobacillus micheneri]|nr:hypothetical protein DY037_05335 [Apilactobacillus micheneri]